MSDHEEELFTVDVFRVSSSQNQSDGTNLSDQMKSIEGFPNIASARIIKGRILELEHSKLGQEDVKFRTVVNYEKDLDAGTYLGISFKHQDGYIGE